jgi:hypothetical protein
MSKNTFDSEIQARVNAFVTDLSQIIREAALDSVRQAWGAVSAPAPRKARKASKMVKAARKPAKGRGRLRRSSEDLESLASALHAHVKSNPGQRLEQIGTDMAVHTKELKRPVQLLLEAGALRTEGQRRGTKYFAGGGRGSAKARGAKRGKRKTAKRKKAGRKTSAKKTAVKAAA